MAMTREEFDVLVKRLENDAKANPQGYQKRVVLLAMLGYVYIFFILAILLSLLGILVLIVVSGRFNAAFIKIGVVLLGLIFVVARSLWVRLTPPDGLELHPEQAGKLFQAVEEIRSILQAPKPDHILLTDDFNAAAAQIPRLGLLGWQRHYLILGLPFMQAVSPEQLKAVIAHEFGHLSGNHGRFGGWIYRIRQSWYQLMEGLDRQQAYGAFLFNKFFDWYAPYFGAYSFVLARANEYVADRCAAEVTGPRTAADALIRAEVAGAYLEENFWPSLYRKANEQPAAPVTLFSDIGRALITDIRVEQASKWYQQALSRKSDSTDTHPSLEERLTALGQEPRLPEPVQETAAAYFFGDALDDIVQKLNHAWKESVDTTWTERHTYAQEAQQRLRELEQKEQSEALTEEEAWERAELTEEFNSDEAALPLYREVMAAQPEHAPAHFSLGRILLSQEDPAGVEHIEKAMQLEPEAVLPGCQLIYEFLLKQGKSEEAQEYYQRAIGQAEQLELAEVERSQLGPKDILLAHGLSSEAIAQLRQQLSRHNKIGQAYLVRKQLEHFSERPLYVLGVVSGQVWQGLDGEEHYRQLCEEFSGDMEFDGECLVVPLHSENAWLKKMMKKVPDAQIYNRKEHVAP